MLIIDAFIFYNEVELLLYRLELLHEVVDYFVIVESTLTHVGKPKEMYFDKSLLERFSNKIIYIIVDDLPFPEEIYDVTLNHHLLNEIFQRNCIQRGIDKLNLNDSDYIIVTDIDEIPDPNTIKMLQPGQVSCACLEQDLYYYNINSKHSEKWYHPKVVNYSTVKSMDYYYHNIRMSLQPVIHKGGWHLSYFGSADFIANKIKNFSHQEYNNDFILNGIQEKIITCTDLYNRKNVLIQNVPVSENDYLPPNYSHFTKEYQFIKNKYIFHCNRADDINEHLPTLYRYALECDSVFETGIRGVTSSYAFALALMGNKNKRYLLNDILPCNIEELYNNCKSFMNIDYIWCNNLHIDFNERFDITFIDTWHVYGQMKRELEKFKVITNKYIIMHDTTVDAWLGENIRRGIDGTEESKISGIPIEEIYKGIWPAINEFLVYNPEWVIHERYTNNNGLTILKRNPVFNENWFSDEQIGILKNLIESGLPKGEGHIIEIGCWEGRSTSSIANFVYPENLICNDTWMGNIEESKEQGSLHPTEEILKSRDVFGIFINNMNVLTKKNYSIVKEDCLTWIPKIKKVKFCHIDGSHDYFSVKRTLELLLPKMVPGGIICGDDFINSGGVQRAVREILPEYKNNGNVWYFTKI